MEPNTSSAQAAQPNTQVAEPVTAPVQPVQIQAPITEPSQDAVAGRTREQFDKLLESNSRLYEQNELMRKEMQDRLGGLPQSAPAAPQPDRSKAPAANTDYDFYEVDPTSGETFINREKLNKYMKDIQEKANRAEVTVQNIVKTTEEREIERQNTEAYAVYPELKLGAEKFDASFYRQVRGTLTDSMLNAGEYGGRPLTFKEAADFVRGIAPGATPVADQGTSSANEGAALKEAGSAQVSSQHQQQIPLQDADELRALQVATRYGSTEALAERIKHSPHIKAGEQA